MKRKFTQVRSFLLGVLTTLLVLGMAVPGFAETVTKSIEVRSGIRVFIDGQELVPKDAKGNPVEVFLYNGTTYLPARAVSEAVGKPIQWDGTVQGVYIGKHSSNAPAAYLSQLDYFNMEKTWRFDGVTKDNLGNEHLHSLEQIEYGGGSGGSVTYRLNDQYSRLTGTYYQIYTQRSSTAKATTVIISGDGRQLWTGTVGAGMDPVSFDLDITGVFELKIEYPTGGNGYPGSVCLGGVSLWS